MPHAPTPTPRPAGPRALIAALEARPLEPRTLELVAVRPPDSLDRRWILEGDGRLSRLLGRAAREAARGAGGTCYRLDRLLFAVLAPDGLVPGAAAMATRAALSAEPDPPAESVLHGSAEVPHEAAGAAALRLAFERLEARSRWSGRSAERQVRDVLLRVLAERRADRAAGGADGAPRVAELAVRVGRRLGLGLDELDVLCRAAELQDLGKLLLPDTILGKVTPLTPAEWAVIRRHPLAAEAILAAAPALAPVARLLRSSCEWYDGSGYPDGLRGSRIPLGARVIAVCVAFDAITADRPYRPALPTRAALQELCRCAGVQFDPMVVAAFCAVAEETGDAACATSTVGGANLVQKAQDLPLART